MRAKAFLPPSCQASSPHSVRTTVPSGFVTGLPGEILLPTSTTRFAVGSFLTPASCSTASMPASSLGCDAGEQVVERQHRVRLAAAEVGLELHHRVAALAARCAARADEQALQALGEVGAAEELGRLLVLVRALAQMHLPEVGGELGLLVAAARHVRVRRHDLAPGLEVAGRRALDQRCRRSCASRCAPARRSASRSSSIFILLDLVGLRRRDGGQQPRHRVERAVGVVAGERLLVRPLVAAGRAAR